MKINKTVICFIYLMPFVFIYQFILGQFAINLDSLENSINGEENDTIRIKGIFLLTDEYLKSDPGKAQGFCNLAFELSNKLNYIPGVIDALSYKARILKLTGQYDSAIFFCEKALELSDSIGDLRRYAGNMTSLGTLIFRKESPEAAKLYYLKSLEISNKIHDSVGIANALNGIGSVFKNQAIYDSAVYYYLKLIRISEKIVFKKGLGMGYLNLGILYSDLKDFAEAESYLMKSLVINEELNNLNYIGLTYNNLGSIAFDRERYDESLKYYLEALAIYTHLNNQLGKANLFNNIGNIYEKKKEYAAAIDNYSKARTLYERIGNKYGLLIAIKNQALIHERWKNYDKALIMYDTSLILAKELNSPDRILEIYFNIFKTYELKNDFQNAFFYQGLHGELKDSIFNIEKSETIADLQLKYEKEKDQARILSLQNENLSKDLYLRKRTNQRNIYLASGSGVILIISFLFIFYSHKVRKDRIIADQKIRQLEEEKKLLAAKSIVEGQEEERKRIAKELHDGLGVLLSTAKMQFTTIKDKSPENRPLIEKAAKLLEQAAGDVRKISHNMMPGLLTRFGLYEAVEDLIDQLNETEEISTTCEIAGNTKRLPENTEIMLYRIIQEMVNNTLKHAEAKTITLKMDILPEILKIRFSDDGKGFNVVEKLESKSIGLSSIQSRVNFLSGASTIESAPGQGVSYTIEIPI